MANDGNQILARISDSDYVYKFVVSKKLDYLLDPEVSTSPSHQAKFYNISHGDQENLIIKEADKGLVH